MQKLLTPSTGYRNLEYASIYGDIQEIDGILFTRRPIKEDYYDLVSIYPFSLGIINPVAIFSRIADPNCVSLTIVTNPIGFNFEVEHFPNPREFKTHYIVDLQEHSREKYSDNTIKNIKKFAKNMGKIEVLPQHLIDTYHVERAYKAYRGLMEKHGVGESPTNFTYENFKKQLFIPGSLLLTSWSPNEPMGGFALFYIDGKDVYYHLSASSPGGYKIGSAFALLHHAINLFKQMGYRYLMLGSGAGVDSTSSLEYFKEGFGTFTAKNYIIGSIINKTVYDRLSRGKSGDYFPLYRSP